MPMARSTFQGGALAALLLGAGLAGVAARAESAPLFAAAELTTKALLVR